jgi:hypothetical protein
MNFCIYYVVKVCTTFIGSKGAFVIIKEKQWRKKREKIEKEREKEREGEEEKEREREEKEKEKEKEEKRKRRELRTHFYASEPFVCGLLLLLSIRDASSKCLKSNALALSLFLSLSHSLFLSLLLSRSLAFIKPFSIDIICGEVISLSPLQD